MKEIECETEDEIEKESPSLFASFPWVSAFSSPTFSFFLLFFFFVFFFFFSFLAFKFNEFLRGVKLIFYFLSLFFFRNPLLAETRIVRVRYEVEESAANQFSYVLFLVK